MLVGSICTECRLCPICKYREAMKNCQTKMSSDLDQYLKKFGFDKSEEVFFLCCSHFESNKKEGGVRYDEHVG